jgi:hypothetical protein
MATLPPIAKPSSTSPASVSTTAPGTAPPASSSNIPGTSDIQGQFAQNMALQTMLGELNLQLGFVTALANAKEALGQACKNRAEASKQLV